MGILGLIFLRKGLLGPIIPRQGLETPKKAIISSSGDLILRPTNEKRPYKGYEAIKGLGRPGAGSRERFLKVLQAIATIP